MDIAAAHRTQEKPRANPLRKLARWWWLAPSWVVSLFVHLLVLVSFASWMLPLPEQPIDLGLEAALPHEVEAIETFAELELPEDLEVEEMEIEEAEPLSELDASSMLGELNSEVALTADSVAAEFSADQPDSLGNPLGDIGEALTSAEEGMKVATTFFGTKAVARRVAFVVDNSNSMSKGRLETALVEIVRAIERLKPTQEFFIVFYSDTAYPLYHPNAAETFVPATNAHKQKVREWFETIEMCLHTDGKDAIEVTRELRPDLVFLLGDGAFTDRTGRNLIRNPIAEATIHVLGMQVKGKDQEEFKAIAEKHNGTYRDVGVSPEGRALFDQYGSRQKNKRRGPVWGLKLPQK